MHMRMPCRHVQASPCAAQYVVCVPRAGFGRVRMYAMRVAERGICVNAVSPGYTDTKEWNKARLAMGKGDPVEGEKVLNAREPFKEGSHPS